jgi:hypothetical protein
MSVIPFPCWAVRRVRIVAVPIAPLRFRYAVVPEGRGKITAYRLDRARETAARYSRKITEIGPAEAFRRRARP